MLRGFTCPEILVGRLDEKDSPSVALVKLAQEPCSILYFEDDRQNPCNPSISCKSGHLMYKIDGLQGFRKPSISSDLGFL